MMSKFHTPTRHGDWVVVNGELIDLNNQPVSPADEPLELIEDTEALNSTSED